MKRYIGMAAPHLGLDAEFGKPHRIVPGWSRQAKADLVQRSWSQREALVKGQGRMVRHTVRVGPLRYVSIYYLPYPWYIRLRNRWFARFRKPDPIAERLKVFCQRDPDKHLVR